MQADDTGGASFVDIPPNSGDNPAKMCAFRSTKILPQRPEWGGAQSGRSWTDKIGQRNRSITGEIVSISCSISIA